MYLIYKITNKINGKVYVGQTKHSLVQRFYSHTRPESYCTKLKNAIKKYGKENFIIEQIDHSHDRHEADSKEIFWIKKYKSTNDKYGYNILNGGHKPSSKQKKKVLCIELNKFFESASDAADFFNCKKVETIARVCRGERPTFKGNHFAYLDSKGNPMMDKIDINSKKRYKKTVCLETGVIFEDSKKASDLLGVSRNAVSMCCRGLTKTIKGYHFRYI